MESSRKLQKHIVVREDDLSLQMLVECEADHTTGKRGRRGGG